MRAAIEVLKTMPDTCFLLAGRRQQYRQVSAIQGCGAECDLRKLAEAAGHDNRHEMMLKSLKLIKSNDNGTVEKLGLTGGNVCEQV